jgi:hypothetical protein
VTKKSRPEGGEFLVIPSCLFFDGVSGVPRRILHITCGVVDGTLGLIDLAFGFHVLVTSELTGTFLDGAFGFLCSALHMFTIHDPVPYFVGYGENGSITESFQEKIEWRQVFDQRGTLAC